jgi:DNA-binding NarL/FixJ family response regulator
LPHSFLIADDNAFSRRLVRNLLTTNLGETFSWLEASDGTEALEKIRASHPDVAIVDVYMPGLNGLELARHVIESGTHTAVLMISIYDATVLLPSIKQQGIHGFVSKSALDLHLIPAIQTLLRGKTYFAGEPLAT